MKSVLHVEDWHNHGIMRDFSDKDGDEDGLWTPNCGFFSDLKGQAIYIQK